MTPDRELLRRYVQQGSEDAFTEIVHRHLNLVYGAALRQLCGNVSLAQDVTQAVFTALAVKASASPGISHLSAWLYTTTRFTVSYTVRTERRRQDREQKAQTMHAILTEPASQKVLEVPPELFDAALEGLDDSDREAILLRFFEGQSFSAIGLTMQLSEDAVRMRVSRALEKIRSLFAKKGITSSAAAVAAALANQAIAAPAGLATSVLTTALGGTAATAAATGAKLGIVAFMTTTKSALWIASIAGILALGYSAHEYHEATIDREAVASLTQERNQLQEALKQSEKQAVQAKRLAADLQLELDRPQATKAAAAAAPKVVQATTNETQKLRAEKMAQMKPLLEAGMPIKGVAVLNVNGKAVDEPIELVMGKETRIEGGDDGTYTVNPTLNKDGSVRYAIVLLGKNANGGSEQPVNGITVIDPPWGSFQFSYHGTTMGFVPDETGP